MKDRFQRLPVGVILKDQLAEDEPIRLPIGAYHLAAECSADLVVNHGIPIQQVTGTLVRIKTNAGQLREQCPAEC